jgi:hypothetical protein
MTDLLANDQVATTLARALGSQYQIVRLLGRGGMGAVYMAHEPFLERDVAVKVLPSEFGTGTARERFLREARTAARLSHPNIVPLYTFGQAEDVLYYVMGYVEGESLEARLQREGRLAPDEVRRITSELAEALEYAHQKGVVHRDIKPDNVLLERATGRALLTDFGVAKQSAKAETLTQTGMIVGTPHYMSPEQASGDRDIDGRSDIYSLGVMAYRMATGRLPFEGSNLRELLAQHATRSPVAPTQIVTSLPLDIDTVITRALLKEPAQRWPNARMVREALSPDSEESVPEDLRNIAHMGTRLVLIVLALVGLVWVGSEVRVFGPFNFWIPTIISALILPLGALGMVQPARRFGWRAALHSFLLKPTWWSGWWPKAFRAPGDVYERLPSFARLFRNIGTIGTTISIPMFAALFHYMVKAYRDPMHNGMWPFLLIAAGYYLFVMAPMGWSYLKFRRLARTLGLSNTDIRRMVSDSTAPSSFWTRPHIAALLSDPAAPKVADRRDPKVLLSELEAVAAKETSSPHAELYKEAARAGGALVLAIERAGDELGQLARDLDPRDRERIQASVAALGPPEQNPSTAKAQMRDLLDRQLQIFRELEARRDSVSSRREHLNEQLRTLALHVARLRADVTTASPELTTQIRAVMQEIDYRVQANDAVRELAARADGER